MNERNLERLILDFDKQKVASPSKYIAGILEDFPEYSEYLGIIKANLKEDGPIRLNEILHFLGHVLHESTKIPGKYGEELVDAIVGDDGVFELLETLFLSGGYRTKHRVLRFFAAVGYDEFDEFLRKSFEGELSRDPLIVPEVIVALERMGKEIPWDLVDEMARAPRFSIRWSFFGLFSSINMDYENTYEYLEMLDADDHPLVRAESGFYRKYLEIINEDMTVNPYLKEYNDGRIHELTPKITFQGVKTSFIDLMRRSGMSECPIDLFEEFVDYSARNERSGIVHSFMEHKKIPAREE
jgi:hypothetical protein